MSTSIYPAFRLSPKLDLFAFSEELRNVLAPRLTLKFQREVVRRAVNAFDEDERDNAEMPFPQFFSQHLMHLGRSLFGAGEKLDRLDEGTFTSISNFQGYLLRNHVRGENYILLRQGVLDAADLEAVLSIEGVLGEYSYYNASDSQLETISEEEWDDRRVAWKETFDLYKDVSIQSLTVKMLNGSSYELLGFRNYEEKSEELLSAELLESRFRGLVMNNYVRWIASLDGIDLDLSRLIMRSFSFMNCAEERDYSKIWKSSEHHQGLEEAIAIANDKVSRFPLSFGSHTA